MDDEKTKLEIASDIVLDAHMSTRIMSDGLLWVSEQPECTTIPYEILEAMWVAMNSARKFYT